MVKAALDRLAVSGQIYTPAINGKGVKIKLRNDEGEAA
jgi:hypothetical protein